jgi:hypothetical protein
VADLKLRTLERRAETGDPRAREALEVERHRSLIPAAFARWCDGVETFLLEHKEREAGRLCDLFLAAASGTGGSVERRVPIPERRRPFLETTTGRQYWKVVAIDPDALATLGNPGGRRRPRDQRWIYAWVDRFTGNVLPSSKRGRPMTYPVGNVLDPAGGLKYLRPRGVFDALRDPIDPVDVAGWPPQRQGRPVWASAE